MQFRKLSGCYECHAIVDPTRYETIMSVTPNVEPARHLVNVEPARHFVNVEPARHLKLMSKCRAGSTFGKCRASSTFETYEHGENVLHYVDKLEGHDHIKSVLAHIGTDALLKMLLSFDHGYYLLVKSIQELRSKKKGVLTVGIGGPSGSGKSSLAEKVASVIGCIVISMEIYRTGVDDGNDLELIDFDILIQNLEDLINGRDTLTPVFDFQGRKRVGSQAIKRISSGVVIVDGTFALHAKLRSLLDIRVAVVIFCINCFMFSITNFSSNVELF
ncbi:P-loop containing nucleoside triphosphate hydrolase superfamily protein [Abeliophyllum distichum]|uniref:P-loop containing nucleoside triphosphate hydrolase superfamily protein n=1 Tax=Abeliophyllum distichum TaxID=126358 RepID=A0ABD1UIV1_9LAMI